MSRVHTCTLFLVVLLLLVTGCSAPATPAPPAPTQPPAQATQSSAGPTQAPIAATSAPSGAQPVKGGAITVSGGVNCADTLNQHISINTGCRMIAHHVLDTLVVVNPKDGSINPSLATSWERSADGLVYTFKLRKDVKFQDGTPFNAQAVKYNLDYTVRPDIKHGFAYG